MDDDKWVTDDLIARGAAAVRRVAELEKTLHECRPLLVHAGCPVDWLDAVLARGASAEPPAQAQPIALAQLDVLLDELVTDAMAFGHELGDRHRADVVRTKGAIRDLFAYAAQSQEHKTP